MEGERVQRRLKLAWHKIFGLYFNLPFLEVAMATIASGILLVSSVAGVDCRLREERVGVNLLSRCSSSGSGGCSAGRSSDSGGCCIKPRWQQD